MNKKVLDIFVIGGGVNGVAIARDAAGRGLNVALAEKGDLASKTSSNSTKLFHGGLRYLEYLNFSLVKEGLKEREILLKNMPHIAFPMRFIMPLDQKLRINSRTPVSRFLSIIMPWLRGRRPNWLIRLGLFLYDKLGRTSILQSTTTVDLNRSTEGRPLKKWFSKGYEYSDVWVDDSRLVSLMARDATEKGALIMTQNEVIGFERAKNIWLIKTSKGSFKARVLINASGPWSYQLARGFSEEFEFGKLRLVKGSHIVVKKLYEHEKAYFFMGKDGRIMFSIPFQKDYTVLGTTEVIIDEGNENPKCSDAEIEYICKFVTDYFAKPVLPSDVIWSYSGIRPLFENESESNTALSRDYFFDLNEEKGSGPLLNIFGGKLTTHRKLAEKALQKISNYLDIGNDWTEKANLPGGDFNLSERSELIDKLSSAYPFLKKETVNRLFNNYGLDAWNILGKAKSISDLGECFGSDLFSSEVKFLVKYEYARCADDILWRRTKVGLKVAKTASKKLNLYIQQLLS